VRGETTKPLNIETGPAPEPAPPAPAPATPAVAPVSFDAPHEASGAAEGLFGDEPEIPEFELEGDDDPLSEKTVDLEIPRELRNDGSISTDESQTVEGAPLLESHTDLSARPPARGERVPADDGSVILLDAPLGDQRGSVFFRAKVEGDEQAYTAVWTPDPPPEPPWDRIPDPRIVRPRCRATLDGAALRVFERPKGNTVVDYLADGERFLPAMATLELGIELAEILESLHGAGQYIYDLDPSQIVIERGGRVRLYAIGGFSSHARPPSGQSGLFAAPEVRRRLTYLIGTHSDVFAVALMIYALLARRSPIDPDLDPNQLLNPRVFRPECPLGIWPYLRPCLAAVPGRRIGHARGLRQQLEMARGRLLREAAAADNPEPIVLEAWAELHTGLGKKRRGAAQQDRALALTDDEGHVGMYIIADGVSRSRYGDGAFASECVKIASATRWAQIEKAGPAGMALSHPQRVDVLRQIARNAGKKISAEVNERHAPLANEPNQVMSTTLAAAFVVHGEATIANLGDSRAYLVRDNTIERISIDHDRTTDALRMGLSFREAAEVRMGAALTRVVGRVIIDENGQSRPDPFEPEIFRVRLLASDRLLLASDGVSDFAAGAGASQYEAELRMLECVQEYEDPARAAYELVVLANRAGGYDNISCVVIAAHPG
jgi:protein phosphatase